MTSPYNMNNHLQRKIVKVNETKNDELLIWNTFINTKIAQDQPQPQPSQKGSSTWRPNEPSMFDGNYFDIIFTSTSTEY